MHHSQQASRVSLFGFFSHFVIVFPLQLLCELLLCDWNERYAGICYRAESLNCFIFECILRFLQLDVFFASVNDLSNGVE